MRAQPVVRDERPGDRNEASHEGGRDEGLAFQVDDPFIMRETERG